MTLADAVKGATYTPQRITWKLSDGTAKDLTGATITGVIEDENHTTRAITGTLALVTAASGIFSWDYSTVDVGTVGLFRVQFKATYSGGEYDLSFLEEWRVRKAL